jgi:TonB family protein
MAKYRLLFILASCLLWTGILYAVSKVRPTLVSDFMDNLNVVKAEREKKPPPPPPPPPPPSCTESPKAPRKLRDFNIDRAYPQRAIDRGQEGTVSATLQIDATGAVVGVVINSANPPGVFESAVEREARRMRYEPARRNCENISADADLSVQFKLE